MLSHEEMVKIYNRYKGTVSRNNNILNSFKIDQKNVGSKLMAPTFF